MSKEKRTYFRESVNTDVPSFDCFRCLLPESFKTYFTRLFHDFNKNQSKNFQKINGIPAFCGSLISHYSVRIFFCILIILFLWGTGPASDDFANLSTEDLRNGNPLPSGIVWTLPVQHYTHFFLYQFLEPDSIFGFAFIKTVYALLSFLMIDSFLSTYTTNKAKRAAAALLLVFLPCHDSTVFWYIGQHMLLSMAFLLYGYGLMRRGKSPIATSVFFLLGSFISYGSPAVVAALGCMCMYRKNWKQLTWLWGLHSIYVVYYSIISKQVARSRLPDTFSIVSLTKQLVLQVGTWADAVIGPSMWFKVFFSISSVTIVSAIAAISSFVIFTKLDKRNTKAMNNKDRKELWVGATAAVGSTIGLFALTGKYPHIAFNLGNRTTLYSSAIVVALLFLPQKFERTRTVFALLFFAAIFGLADHWRHQTTIQTNVVHQMLNNGKLSAAANSGKVFVTGNFYSRLGKLDHIEFLSENWVPHGIIRMRDPDVPMNFYSLDSRCTVKNDVLVDKYGVEVPLEGDLFLYNSRTDTVKAIHKSKLPAITKKEKQAIRHWVFLLKNNALLEYAVKLMPRLEYLLNESEQ